MTKLKTLSDTDISKYCSQLKLPLENILMRDEIKDNLKEGFYVVNLDTSKNDGTHWTVCYSYPLKSCYFDSFGFVPPLELEEKIKPYIYNDKDIQDWDSDACGWYCIAFIKFLHDKMNKELAFKEFLNLFKSNTKENDKILREYLKDISERI
jgi:thioredoxin-related protein